MIQDLRFGMRVLSKDRPFTRFAASRQLRDRPAVRIIHARTREQDAMSMVWVIGCDGSYQI